MPHFFPKINATRLQALTYLLGIALFSISFLVFLNSSISFVVTDVIGQKEGVGDAVGTLGFADELLALVACPVWGLLSDRIGVRAVAVAGYCIVALSLICLVQSTNVYPELLLGRLGFSIGGAACSTMVTAVLPSMVAEKQDARHKRDDDIANTASHSTTVERTSEDSRAGRRASMDQAPPSLSSELTITPYRYASNSRQQTEAHTRPDDARGKRNRSDSSQLAGFVGLFTGAGALLALGIFLPLPAYFQDEGQSQANSVQLSFYIVGLISLCVAVFIFWGLRGLAGEEGKGFSALFVSRYDETTKLGQDGHLHTTLSPAPSYFAQAKESLKLGFVDPAIGLGYVGGFVARASSVGISLFIPLFVNAYFVREGLCVANPENLPDIKENCKMAYRTASALSGIAETAALICAPLFGWLGGRVVSGNPEWPLLASSLFGIVGYVTFGLLKNPDAFHGQGGQWALISVILVGISQIGSIVCSLALLGRGVNSKATQAASRPSAISEEHIDPNIAAGVVGRYETAPLLPDPSSSQDEAAIDRSRLKGSIAGIYSLAGGAGILLLTKVGGVLFDSWTPGAPFFLMAIFNGLLLVAVSAVSIIGAIGRRSTNDNDYATSPTVA